VQGDFFIHDWLVQPQINTIEKGSRKWHLEPKVMQVLVHLALHPNEVLLKEKLIETIWRDTFVGDDVLIRCISEIRYVFGDDPRSPFVIQTIPKAGYRLIGTVTTELDTTKGPPGVTNLATPANGNHVGSENKYELAVDGNVAVTTREPIKLELATGMSDEVSSVDSQKKTRNDISPTDALVMTPAPSSDIKSTSITYRKIFLLGLLVVTLIGIVWGTTYSWKLIHLSPFNIFWAPVLEASEPVLFCIADQNQYSFITVRDAAEPTRQVILKENLSTVVIDDLGTIVRIAGVLQAQGKNHHLKGEEATTLSDLRNGPSVFVGAFDNAWTLRLTKSLRYHFANNQDMTQFKIVDSNDPSRSDWVIDRTQQMATNNYKDFAIVARFIDSNTGKPAIIVAGIGRGGTTAAGEFLTDPDDLGQLIHAAQSGNKKNMEIVLSTQIIDGQPGTPKMEALYFW
jgi:DNA-binding winged helix-turn-helix (wHTH) protein